MNYLNKQFYWRPNPAERYRPAARFDREIALQEMN